MSDPEGYDLWDEVEDDEDYGVDLDDEDDFDDEDGEQEDSGSVLGPNGPRVCAEQCSTCVFRPGNLMNLRPGRLQHMVRTSVRNGSFITCHSTLPYSGTGAPPAICRGFFDSYGHASNVLRIWSRLGPFDEVEPPKLHG